jgi:hypothetical protein
MAGELHQWKRELVMSGALLVGMILGFIILGMFLSMLTMSPKRKELGQEDTDTVTFRSV